MLVIKQSWFLLTSIVFFFVYCKGITGNKTVFFTSIQNIFHVSFHFWVDCPFKLQLVSFYSLIKVSDITMSQRGFHMILLFSLSDI